MYNKYKNYHEYKNAKCVSYENFVEDEKGTRKTMVI